MGSNTTLGKILAKECRSLENDPPPGIVASCVGDSLMNWHALISGPRDSVFEGGTFRVLLVIPENYPNIAPKVTFLSKMYHPNVYRDGEVCMGILAEKWKPTYGLRQILIALQALLAFPNPKSPANTDARNDFVNHPGNSNYRNKVQEVVRSSETFNPTTGKEAEINYVSPPRQTQRPTTTSDEPYRCTIQ